MSSYKVNLSEWAEIHSHILHLEQEGLVTRTFRRLDPERQQAVLLAILEEAAEVGPALVNIKQVAERAGVSVGSLYTYFPSRDGMVAFVVELCVRWMRDALESFRPHLPTLTLREALTVYLTVGIEWSQAFIGLVRLFARAAYHGDPELQEPLVLPIATLLREMVHEMLTQAVERGEVREDVDLEATVRILHALTVCVGDSQLLPYLNTYFQVIDETITPERALDALLQVVLHGIGRTHRREEPDG
jgi:AcrR family transcriptional regulator